MSHYVSPFDRTLSDAGEALVTGLTVICLLLLFLVSNMMLGAIGLEYETPGGSPLEKIHPASYVAALALAALFLVRLDPIGTLDDIIASHPGLVVMAIATLLLILQIVFVQRSPITMVFDTFFLPMVLLILLTRIRAAHVRALAILLHLVMTANAIIGLGEFATGLRVTPLAVQGVELTWEWRSSALLGHPLANATLTGAYLMMLFLGGGRDLPGPLRALFFAIQLPAMAVFGGRAALVFLLVFGAVLAFRNAVRVISGRRITLVGAATLTFVLPAVAASVAALVVNGFFDRFIDRFFSDDGSADARVSMLALFHEIPFRDIVFGPDPEQVATIQRIEGMQFGIESFWIAMVFFYGLAAAIPFFIGFMLFLRDVMRATRPQSAWIIAYYLVTISTSASLSGKTTSLAFVTALILLFFRNDDDAAVSRNGAIAR